jgi:hypothetical protein
MKRLARKLFRLLPDAAYLRLLYMWSHRRPLRLRRPRTFNEKLQWYKLHYRDPLMVTLSDKLAVRGYLEARGHGRLLNEMYGVYDRPEDIDFDSLPERFVLKATHGSNMNIICRDRSKLDREKSIAMMRGWLATDFFYSGRQWCYQGIRPRLICEKYLENEEFGELLDYKFYCFGGKPEILWVCSGRYGAGGVKYNAYDMNWRRIRIFKGKPGCDLDILMPANFPAMVATARELCGAFPFIRVDLYAIGGKLIFGEFTFYPDSGLIPFTPDGYNAYFGDLLVLPQAQAGAGTAERKGP